MSCLSQPHPCRLWGMSPIWEHCMALCATQGCMDGDAVWHCQGWDAPLSVLPVPMCQHRVPAAHRDPHPDPASLHFSLKPPSLYTLCLPTLALGHVYGAQWGLGTQGHCCCPHPPAHPQCVCPQPEVHCGDGMGGSRTHLQLRPPCWDCAPHRSPAPSAPFITANQL